MRGHRRPLLLAALILLMLLMPVSECYSTWRDSDYHPAEGQWNGTRPLEGHIGLDNDSAAPPDWYLVDEGSPSPRYEHEAISASGDECIVSFGGRSDFASTSTLNDTWIYGYKDSVLRWYTPNPDVAPHDRTFHAMAYDRANRVVVLYGGMYTWNIYSQYLDDTWTYNVSTNIWRKMDPPSSPGMKWGHMMAYDESQGAVVLFGGYNRGNETWAYNVSNDTWTNMRPLDPPPARYDGALVYDAWNGASVLFGGHGDSGLLDDTWTYDLGTNTWTELELDTVPPAREGHAMAFQRDWDQTVLYGGATQTGDYLNDTWTFDGTSWGELALLVTPSNRRSHALIYFDSWNRTVLYGGLTMGMFIEIVARMDSLVEDWRPFDTPVVPTFLTGHSLTYDPVGGESVLFGGFDETRTARNDTWGLYSGTWFGPRRAPLPARGLHGMVYSPWEQVHILFGGEDGHRLYNDTWVYDGGTWTEKSPTHPPSARSDFAMCFDSKAGVVVLFGGRDGLGKCNDTWTYDLASDEWTQLYPVSSPPRNDGVRMAFDDRAQVAVLYEEGTTYVLNLTQNRWIRVSLSSAPVAGIGSAMAYDTDAERVLIYGGHRYTGGVFGELWGYDFAVDDWTQVPAATVPVSRCYSAIAYDEGVHALVSFGGAWDWRASRHLGDTWEFGRLGYALAGTYESEVHDCGGQACFGDLTMYPYQPNGTTVGVQLRTADTREDLSSASYIGPDGTSGTFYEAGPPFMLGRARVPSVHNGSRWVQYRATLTTGDRRVTPRLGEVDIVYNVLHELVVSSPIGGVNWTGTHNITWSVNDPDGDDLTFDIVLLNVLQGGTDGSTLASGLPNGTTGWEWDTAGVPNGTYRLLVSAVDANADIPLTVNVTTPEFDIWHPPPPNRAPVVELLSPEDGAELNQTPVTLVWNGSDADGDSLSYSVFLSRTMFDATTLPARLTVTSNRSLTVADVLEDKWYYWTVVPNDGKQDGSVPDVREFLLHIPRPENHPPTARLLTPPNGSTIDTETATLVWAGSDEDGDDLMYLLYRSNASFDPTDLLPYHTVTDRTTISLNGLDDGEVVWWTVVPFDGLVNGVSPGVWSFRVELPKPPVNRAPTFTSLFPANATEGVAYSYNASATDPDGDVLAFGLEGAPSGMSIDPSTGRLTWVPAKEQAGVHAFRVVVTDGRGGRAVQEVSVDVREPLAVKPECAFWKDHVEAKRGDRVVLNGTSRDGTRDVIVVQVRVDGGPWFNASGILAWTYVLETSALQLGTHVVEARAHDGTLYSDTKQMEIVVKPQDKVREEPVPPYGLIAALVLCACAVVVAALLLRRDGAAR